MFFPCLAVGFVGSGLCDKLITHLEEFYRFCLITFNLESSTNEAA
jgi:hypothetical protein